MGDVKKVSWRDVDYEELEKAIADNDRAFLSHIDWDGWDEAMHEMASAYIQAVGISETVNQAMASATALSTVGLSAIISPEALADTSLFKSAFKSLADCTNDSLLAAARPLTDAVFDQLQPLSASLEKVSEYIGKSIDITPLTRWASRRVNKLRHTTSKDFSENHAACQRFREWVETADATKGKRGEWTLSKLAEILGVSRKAASSYYQHPETMSEFAALSLHGILGDEEYFNLVHGPGAYDRKLAEEEKARAIERLRDEFEALLARAEGADLSGVMLVAASIESGIIAAERQLRRNPWTAQPPHIVSTRPAKR